MPDPSFVPHDQVHRATRHAARAARRAAYAARRAERMQRRRGRPPVFLGFLVVAIGLLLLFDNLGLVEAREFIFTYWPALIVAWGMLRLTFGIGAERLVGVLAMLIGTILLGNRLLGWGINPWDLLWPLLIIAFGLHLLFAATMPRPRWQRDTIPPIPPIPPAPGIDGTEPPSEPAADEIPADVSSVLKESAITAGVQRRNASQTFRGGEITVVMGSLELDLRDSRIAGDEAELNVYVSLGNVELTIPRDWAVESHVSVVLGNLEDRSPRPLDPSAKRLIIRGYTFMGNIEIRD
jgi:hypothetical protein